MRLYNVLDIQNETQERGEVTLQASALFYQYIDIKAVPQFAWDQFAISVQHAYDVVWQRNKEL